MDVVCHQTVSPYLNLISAAIIPQRFYVKSPVPIVKKDIGAVVTSLGYVMRLLSRYDTGYSWHMRQVR